MDHELSQVSKRSNTPVIVRSFGATSSSKSNSSQYPQDYPQSVFHICRWTTEALLASPTRVRSTDQWCPWSLSDSLMSKHQETAQSCDYYWRILLSQFQFLQNSSLILLKRVSAVLMGNIAPASKNALNAGCSTTVKGCLVWTTHCISICSSPPFLSQASKNCPGSFR